MLSSTTNKQTRSKMQAQQCQAVTTSGQHAGRRCANKAQIGPMCEDHKDVKPAPQCKYAITTPTGLVARCGARAEYWTGYHLCEDHTALTTGRIQEYSAKCDPVDYKREDEPAVEFYETNAGPLDWDERKEGEEMASAAAANVQGVEGQQQGASFASQVEEVKLQMEKTKQLMQQNHFIMLQTQLVMQQTQLSMQQSQLTAYQTQMAVQQVLLAKETTRQMELQVDQKEIQLETAKETTQQMAVQLQMMMLQGLYGRQQ
jgi:hypothetical protein